MCRQSSNMCQEEENKKFSIIRDIELINVERFHNKTTCCDHLLPLSSHLQRTSTPLSSRKLVSDTYLPEDEIDTEGAYLKFCFTIENRPLQTKGIILAESFLETTYVQSEHLPSEQMSWISNDECEEANMGAIGSGMNLNETCKEADLGVVAKYNLNNTIIKDLCIFYEHVKKQYKNGKYWKVKMKLLLMLLRQTMKKLIQPQYNKKSKFVNVVSTLINSLREDNFIPLKLLAIDNNIPGYSCS